ncbi:hypothetical protein Ciccas_003788 [Cichlidogyrus casuarinus]|uniref:Uncharacterized protein n=1 Tax=Cichlidogyrus casuarinus TaxID=1844966 RepID=A0ABD2QDD0_9PLAT
MLPCPGEEDSPLTCDRVNAMRVNESRGYELTDFGTCVYVNTKQKRPVGCESKTEIKAGVCRANDLTFFVEKTTSKLNGCECVQNTSIETCNCFCPKIDDKQECDPRTGTIKISMIEKSELKNDCECVKSYIHREKALQCKETPRLIEGACVNGSMEVISVKEIADKSSCSCHQKTIDRALIPCGISSNATCHDNNTLTQIKYTFGMDSLGLIKVNWVSSRKLVECHEEEAVKKCEPNATMGHLIKTSYSVKNCTCVPEIKKTATNCQCPKEKTAVKTGICNKVDCTRTDTFEESEYDEIKKTCVTVQKSKLSKCCCLDEPEKKRCNLAGQFVVHKTQHELKNNTCHATVIESTTSVNCSTDVIIEDDCNNSTGISQIHEYRMQVR